MQNLPMYSQMQPQFPEHEHLNCPRCDSPNTKFCYYNNYNLSQPRYFCKNCKRYWTKGGTLRNIPVGGASRKPAAKRASSPTASSSAASKRPTKAADKGEGQFGNLSFGSLLGSNGYQYTRFLDGPGPNSGPGLEIGNDGGGWCGSSNELTDFAVSTPPNFQRDFM